MRIGAKVPAPCAVAGILCRHSAALGQHATRLMKAQTQVPIQSCPVGDSGPCSLPSRARSRSQATPGGRVFRLGLNGNWKWLPTVWTGDWPLSARAEPGSTPEGRCCMSESPPTGTRLGCF